MRSGFLPARVVHLHPTRACNLACAHCYSESAPGVRETLDVELVIDALAALREQGYEILSISGGEPLVYPSLDRLIAAAAQQGYRVHMITNGLLLDERRLASLAQHMFLVGVSLDGAEQTHNAVRRRPDAFQKAIRALRVLSSANVPFGMIYAVTAQSLGDIPWAFEQAQELGASLFHLRPLAPQGRARTLADSWVLTPKDCARLYLLAELLGAGSPGLPHVQVDLVATEHLAPARDQFELLRSSPRITQLSDAVNPLIIDSQGRYYPFVYGIDKQFELGTLSEGVPECGRGCPTMFQRLRELLEAALDEAELEQVPYLDWFAHLARMSHATRVIPA